MNVLFFIQLSVHHTFTENCAAAYTVSILLFSRPNISGPCWITSRPCSSEKPPGGITKLLRNGGTLKWKEREGLLKKSVPTKIHIQTIDRKSVATRNKKTLELNDLLLNLCSTQKWNTNIRCRRMIPWNPEFTADLPRMKAKIVWVTVTSLLYCLARKKEKNRLAALKIHV